MYEILVSDVTDENNNINLGKHEFAAVPRSGEVIILRQESGQHLCYLVTLVAHYADSEEIGVSVKFPTPAPLPYLLR